MSQNNSVRTSGVLGQVRSEKLKEIDALYQAQIKQIYTESKEKLAKQEAEQRQGQTKIQGQSSLQSPLNLSKPSTIQSQPDRLMQNAKSASTLNLPESQSSSKVLGSSEGQQRIRASTLLRGESVRTIESLRRENESKELKIRELATRCESLIERLRGVLGREEFQLQMQALRGLGEGKMERLQQLFRIRQEEIFFTVKLQVVGLLQEFQVPKEHLAEFNQIASQSALFELMARKLKGRLRDFRSREQENSFELQRDRILGQKQEERIHFLTQTNELLKLSQSKLKSKIEDLKGQLNDYLEKMKSRQQEHQQSDNEVFRLRRLNEELESANQKLVAAAQRAAGQRLEEAKVWEGKEREMKVLLNSYFVQKKKLETQREEQDGEMEQLIIKLKFSEQENDRLNRQLIRWKERCEWTQKEKEGKLKEAEEERKSLTQKFQLYKMDHNDGIEAGLREEIDEAIRKVEQYQRSYQQVFLELQQQRALLRRCEEQTEQRLYRLEHQWLEKVRCLQKTRQQQVQELGRDCEARINQTQQQYTKKQQLLAQEMQARLKAMLAEKDKQATEQLIEVETENQQLRREISDLAKIIEVKESLINVISHKKGP